MIIWIIGALICFGYLMEEPEYREVKWYFNVCSFFLLLGLWPFFVGSYLRDVFPGPEEIKRKGHECEMRRGETLQGPGQSLY